MSRAWKGKCNICEDGCTDFISHGGVCRGGSGKGGQAGCVSILSASKENGGCYWSRVARVDERLNTNRMVNNAGVGVEGVPIHELSEDRWESIMYVFPPLGIYIASGGCCFLFQISPDLRRQRLLTMFDAGNSTYTGLFLDVNSPALNF
jgi:hypothetical protein